MLAERDLLVVGKKATQGETIGFVAMDGDRKLGAETEMHVKEKKRRRSKDSTSLPMIGPGGDMTGNGTSKPSSRSA